MAAERSLRVLHTQAEHELGEAAATFADASTRHAAAALTAREVEAANDLSRQELRRLAESPVFNTAIYETVRRMLKAGHVRMAAANESLAQTSSQLDEARMELARRRQRESDLARAVDVEQRKTMLAQQVRDGLIVDDLWLQANGRRE